jgi:outer membrane receptor protein involved in Fe transport
VDLSLTYGSARSRVTENGNAALVGKQVAGVPRYTGTLSATWRPADHWSTTATWRRVGAYAVNADNSVAYGGYATVDVGVVYRPTERYEVYATVSNLTDKAYATSASVIGGTQVFAPGAPRTFKIGAQLSF